MTSLIVATQNSGKLAEIQSYLTDLSWELQLMPSELEIEETGVTFQENAVLKATQTARYTGQWAIADDSGLAVTALKGAPGIYSARYGKTDDERIDRLLRALADQEDRSAQFICVIAIANPDGDCVLQSQGICPGEILMERRGDGGFGYDPIFWVPDCQQTYAEMPKGTKRQISHRGRAFAQLLDPLNQLAANHSFS